MTELHFNWLEPAILAPLAGAFVVWRVRDAELALKRSLWISGLTLALTLAAWIDFATLQSFEARGPWDVPSLTADGNVAVIDALSAPLLPLASLLYFLTMLATSRTKVRRYPYTLTLVSESLLLAMLSCRQPWWVIVLLAAQSVPVFLELRAKGRSTNVLALHTLLFVGLLVGGWALFDFQAPGSLRSLCGVAMLIAGVLVRSGVVPVHCWITDLFEKAAFGSALLYVVPMAGAYAAVRVVLPIAPDWALRSIALMSLVTAVYAAGMALVQTEARRFFCYLFLSNSSLVLVGLQVATPVGLTGGLCVWLSVGVSLAGFGLTLRALEARTGRISLADYHGLYEHMPMLAVFFLMTGLASVGFPGTVGFIGTELLIEGAVDVYPHVGMLVVIAAALNSIAVLHAYLRLFTGTVHTASISLRARLPERIAVISLTALLLGGGLLPQPGVASRYHAATEIIARRFVKPSTAEHSAELPETEQTLEAARTVRDHGSTTEAIISK